MKTKHVYILLGLITLSICSGVLIAQKGGALSSSPAAQGQVKGKDFRVKPADSPQPRQAPALALRGIDVSRVADGSAIGQVDDLVLVITGQGFIETDLSPIVHLEKGISLEETYASAEGDVLYAVVPKDLAARIGKLDLSRVRVQNPGGLNAAEEKWAQLPMEKGQLQRLIQAAPAARFNRGEYQIEMKR